MSSAGSSAPLGGALTARGTVTLAVCIVHGIDIQGHLMGDIDLARYAGSR